MIEKQKEKILKATCDKCGADCMHSLFDSDGDRDDHDDHKNFEGMILETYWGFTSNKDGEHWIAVLCENCVDKYLADIPFIKDFYL